MASDWLIVDLEAQLTESEPGHLVHAELHLGEHVYRASERIESLLDQPLRTGVPLAGSLAFEVPEGKISDMGDPAALQLGLNRQPDLDTVIEVGLIVAAFVLRSVLGRLKTSYPRATAPAVVYLETLWIFLAILAIEQYASTVSNWAQQRQAMVWLDTAQGWLVEHLYPVAWLWAVVTEFIGHLGAVLLPPSSRRKTPSTSSGTTKAISTAVSLHHRENWLFQPTSSLAGSKTREVLIS
ncbi:hypothetical protein HGQ17_05255 [Nesterenkonia sp. MY13]|uniref:Uncharacterized protein n=1 Tax=Nesterenkonia sedimenti TaxID=1463632 RepID=A0A7X8TIK9_9MICC|nr:hypothetical protein [Nesterenkonia sedimenti]NLS09426.1 hypothetical protein [Nesterenkonia sedimenti]